MLLGGFRYRVAGNSTRFFKVIAQRDIPAESIREDGEDITLSVSAEYTRKFLKACKDSECTAEKLDTFGLIRYAGILLHRPGLIAGFILAVVLMVYFSDVVITLKVDTEDESLRTQVIEVLKDEGIYPGAYIPDIDLVIAERSLKRKIDDISWAGITRTGCGLSVDIIENIRPVKGIASGMPCHLIACENGVIEEVEILDGELKKCIGSGVTKGDLIVSGDYITEEDQWHDGETVHVAHHNYVRSTGTVKGTFERTLTFEQPFETVVKASVPHEERLYFIDYFDIHIPLFHSAPEGFFTSRDTVHTPELFGLELPFSLCRSELTEYDRVPVTLTEDEAFSEAEKKAEKYEENFLKEYELKDRSETRSVSDKGVSIKVRYTLYGSMVRESEFFMPKLINDMPVYDDGSEK